MPKFTLSIVFMLVFYQRPHPMVHPSRPDLNAIARQGYAVMRAGNFPQAENLFRGGLGQARQLADWRYVSGFLSSLGVASIHQARYRQALDYFLQSQNAARQAGADKELAIAATNIGVIYTRLGDWQKGHAAMLAAAREIAPDELNTLQINLADYESRLRNYSNADRNYRAGIENADRLGINAIAAAGWERWGLSFLERGDLAQAEHCLLESYRQHRLAKRPEAEQLHYGFARLALAQGDIPEARRRAAQYVKAARSAPLLYPLWEAYRITAEIEERDGNASLAHKIYYQGVDWARQGRAERIPSSQLIATAESSLQSLYLGLIRTAQQMNERHPNQALLVGALEAAEDGSNSALAENTAQLPDDYWQTLDSLQRIQARRLAQDSPQLTAQSESLRARLVQLESTHGLAGRSSQQLIAAVRKTLMPGEAIFVFRTGEPHSYVWTLTRNDIELRTLPGERQLASEVDRFRADVVEGRALSSKTGKKLFSEIIGEFSVGDATNMRWTLVPDGPLHELPFAALPWPAGRQLGTHLVQHRSLLTAPSLANLAVEPGSVPQGPAFAGIADPIYNSADPRLLPSTQRADISGSFRITPRLRTTLELARLPGSQAELDAAVKILQPRDPVLLTGAAVNRQAFLKLLDRQNGTLHLATHVVAETGNPRHAFIALGLNPQTREQDLVGAEEISGRRHSARLVVMSGCGSGRGQALPGAGLLSLTRAWILSGATGVIGSHWPVPDNSGPLFARFYRYSQDNTQHTQRAANAGDWALALQHAQVEAIHERVPASIWAAYFLTGRN